MELHERVLDLLAGGVWYALWDLTLILGTTRPAMLRALKTLTDGRQITRRRVGSVYVYGMHVRGHADVGGEQGSDEVVAQQRLLGRLFREKAVFHGERKRALLNNLPLPAFVSDARFRILQWSPVLTQFFDQPAPGVRFTDYFRGYPDMLPWCPVDDKPLSSIHFIDSVVLPTLARPPQDRLMPSGIHLVRLRHQAREATEQFFYFSLLVPVAEGGIYGFIAPASGLVQKGPRKRIWAQTKLGLTHSFGQPLNAIASVEASLIAMQTRIARFAPDITRMTGDLADRLEQLSDTLRRVRTSFTVIRENLPGIADLETAAIDFLVLLDSIIEQEQRIAATHGITLKFEPENPGNSWLVWSAGYPLAEAIHCLIRNGMNSTPSGTSLTIACKTGEGVVELSIRNKTSGSKDRLEFLKELSRNRSGNEISGTALAHNVARDLGGRLTYCGLEDDFIETTLAIPAIVIPAKSSDLTQAATR